MKSSCRCSATALGSSWRGYHSWPVWARSCSSRPVANRDGPVVRRLPAPHAGRGPGRRWLALVTLGIVFGALHAVNAAYALLAADGRLSRLALLGHGQPGRADSDARAVRFRSAGVCAEKQSARPARVVSVERSRRKWHVACNDAAASRSAPFPACCVLHAPPYYTAPAFFAHGAVCLLDGTLAIHTLELPKS